MFFFVILNLRNHDVVVVCAKIYTIFIELKEETKIKHKTKKNYSELLTRIEV